MLRGGVASGIFWVPAFGEKGEDSGSDKSIRELSPDPLWSASQTLLSEEFEAITFCPASKAEFALVLRRVGDAFERVGLLTFLIRTVVDNGVTETLECGYKGDEVIQAERRIVNLV